MNNVHEMGRSIDPEGMSGEEKKFCEVIESALIRIFLTVNFDYFSSTFDSDRSDTEELLHQLRNYGSRDLRNYISRLKRRHKGVEFFSLFVIKPYTSENPKYLTDNYFYPIFKLHPPDEKNPISKIDLYIPESFMKHGIKGSRATKSESDFDTQFAHSVNYYTKYLWHTYVHNKLQGINDTNYKLFKGEAREDSDYTADSVATYLLMTSYGVPMVCDNHRGVKGEKDVLKRSMINIFEGNKSSNIFREREGGRAAENKNDNLDFRFKRNLLNYISGYILAEGYPVESVKVFLGPDRNVVLRVNDVYYHTHQTPKTEGNEIRPSYSENKELFRKISQNVTFKMDELCSSLSDAELKELEATWSAQVERIIEKNTTSKYINSRLRKILVESPVGREFSGKTAA